MRRNRCARSTGPDFEHIWRAFALSEFGVAFSAGAIAVIAVDRLDASAAQVAVIFAIAGLAAAAASLPVGPFVERRAKRPVLVGADLVRAATTLAVPLSMWADLLHAWVLVVATAVNAFFSVVFASANDAHLKAIVLAEHRLAAYARLERTRWTLIAVATPLGGLVVSLAGPSATMTIDAATYLGSALFIRSIRRPEPTRIEPEVEVDDVPITRQITSGWRYVVGVDALRSLFLNAMLFGGALRMATPVIAVFALRDLGLAPWQYGLVLGVPAIGGMVGARLAPSTQARFGSRQTLLGFGTARTLWMVWIAFAPDGTSGFVVVLMCEVLLMLCAGIFNPTYAARRTSIVEDRFMARVGATWPITAMTVQPIFMLIGAGLLALVGVRTTLAIAGVALISSSLLLPWRSPT